MTDQGSALPQTDRLGWAIAPVALLFGLAACGHDRSFLASALPSPSPAPGTTIVEAEGNRPPVGIFEVRPGLVGPAPYAVRFYACDSRDQEGDALRFRFETGEEGRASQVTATCNWAYEYQFPGIYRTQLCVADSTGLPGHEVCATFELEVYGGGSGKPSARVYTHAIGYGSCPTGATTFSDTKAIRAQTADQALLACQACMGAGACGLDLSDCAGPAYGDPTFQPTGDRPRWGFDAGCSGPAGRVFRLGDSTVTFGRWAK